MDNACYISISNYIANIAEYNNMQTYLADINGDGVVTVRDRTALEKILADSE